MKKLFSVIILLTLVLPLFWECSTKNNYEVDATPPSPEVVANDEHFVSIDQVEAAVNRFFPTTKARDRPNHTITPLLGTTGDTLMYVVNTGGHGWKILSSDSRTPAILAEGDDGAFSLDDGNYGLVVWIDCMKTDMEAVRNANDDQLNFSEEEIRANKAFWSQNTPRGYDDPTPSGDGGRWRTITTTETITVETRDHMTPHWDQSAPYNAYCPFRTDITVDRAPAGCVPVAGAEVLFYLHDTLGVPATIVSDGYCTGNVGLLWPNYQQDFFTPTTTAWAAMDTAYHSTSGTANAEAILIGHVGKLIGVHYYNEFSWAWPPNLRTDLFAYYGINCSQGNYDADIVKTNLEAGLPVIVTASNLEIPTDFDIHCFVIDAYKKTYVKSTHYHYWLPDDPFEWFDPDEYAPYYTYSYSSPTITAIKINWGWWSQWDENYQLNNGWYSLTGTWYTIDSNNNESSYDYNRTMIYGFTISE